jgi:hypothetical protein
MKNLLGCAFITLFITSCASSGYHYQTQNNPIKWKNQNISAVMKAWGQPDQTVHTRTGVSYYAYQVNSGSDFFNTTTSDMGTNYMPANGLQTQVSAQCMTIFKTNSKNIITNGCENMQVSYNFIVL